MQTVSDTYLAALDGSVEPVFTAELYYNGEQVTDQVQISGGQVEDDSTQEIRSSCSLLVADPDGQIVPTSRTSPLAPFGQEVLIRAGLNLGGKTELTPMGWFVLDQATPSQSWRWMRNAAQFVASGAQVPITGKDRWSKIVSANFLVPEQVKASTVWAEITRLAQDLVPVLDPGFDTSIPSGSVTYSTSRSDAIRQLASLCSAHPVMTPDGQLTLALDQPASTAPVWALTAGPDGNVGQFQPVLSSANVHNGVSVTGQDSSGNPIFAALTQADGPLMWGGPFGMRPADPITDLTLTTQDAVNARVTAELAKALQGDSQSIDVPTVLNYALQLEDYVDVDLPIGSGPVQVTKLVKPTRGTMTTTIAVPDAWVLHG